MRKQTIRYVIERSFLMACSVILIIVISGAVYFSYMSSQATRQAALQKNHDMLSHLLIPEISISNTVEMKRLLRLASSSDETFGVIDASGNFFTPDYSNVEMLKMFFSQKSIIRSCHKLQNVYRYINGNKYWVNCTLLYKDNLVTNNQNLGALVSFSKQKLTYFSSLMVFFILVGSAILLLLFVWFRRVLYKRLLKPLVILGRRISESANIKNTPVASLGEIGDVPSEVMTIKTAFESVLSKLQVEYQQRVEVEKKSALLDLAARVAHDIRSPIAVMEMSLKMVEKNASNNEVNTMKMAIQSVRDIANNLLDRYRNNHREDTTRILIQDDGQVSRPILLCSLVEQVVSQKRHEWLGRPCELVFSYDPAAKAIWIDVVPNDIKRMLSNLLNNAIEACQDDALIKIQVNIKDTFIEVDIIDNGIGIPLEKIASCLSGDSTKHVGKGLGLSGANQYMKSIGGELLLLSHPGTGCNITLKFIIDRNPNWYPSHIALSDNNIVVVLDDDISIQTLWFHRLQNYPVKIQLFSSYDEAITWFDNNRIFLDNIIFLVDYELADSQADGLTLLEHVSAKNRGYLVSSHAEESVIQRRVEALGVWMIPKALAFETPIMLSDNAMRVHE